MENCAAVFDKFLPDWKYMHNGEAGNTIRIWLGWDPNILDVEEIQKTKQFIHAKVSVKGTTVSFHYTVVYAHNNLAGQKVVWEDVGSVARAIASPWAIQGDFNVIRNQMEKIGGEAVRFEAMEDFNSFIDDAGLIDLKWKGEAMTWNNRQSGDSRICCKLDRVMVNLAWMDVFRSSEATIHPPGLSDHSPVVVTVLDETNFGPKPFRFFEAWIGREGYVDVVQKGWEKPVSLSLNPILWFAARLRNVKAELRKWNRECIGDVFLVVKAAEAELHHIQCRLDAHPDDQDLVLLETQAKKKLWDALSTKEKFLKEKSRGKHIQLGDGNNGFFHKSMICRHHRKHILEIQGEGGDIVKEPSQIKEEAVSFYKCLGLIRLIMVFSQVRFPCSMACLLLNRKV
ncbi:uncharacterized protein LOC122648063 [Telopea speciosissima]|uniref:uncharacterized protein LOC122648063 n=1 Tax=Telopea speciosissima TaxID=54955 RepID=UPI001CC69D09|nr:uncharacterized protein LOC122648063 [Telopea speciosissima]